MCVVAPTGALDPCLVPLITSKRRVYLGISLVYSAPDLNQERRIEENLLVINNTMWKRRRRSGGGEGGGQRTGFLSPMTLGS